MKTSTWIALVSISCFLLNPDFSYAQKSNTSINIAYFGNNFWNPGAQFQVNSTIKNNVHHLQLSFFTDPQSHSALLINYGISIYKKTFYFEVSPLGLFRSILRNTYSISENGSVSEPSNFSGNWYYSPGLSIGIHKRRRFHTKLQFQILTPYNSTLMPLVNWSIGYRIYQPKI
ncbi:hypothetical protein [Portibacter lacus]|uniref:hypothetical protein n=1 Tax=Portibacter lacus TaxID=1099794 RepID=UPI001F3A3F82|nr:hypothetical protein [Portibacter lacus]